MPPLQEPPSDLPIVVPSASSLLSANVRALGVWAFRERTMKNQKVMGLFPYIPPLPRSSAPLGIRHFWFESGFSKLPASTQGHGAPPPRRTRVRQAGWVSEPARRVGSGPSDFSPSWHMDFRAHEDFLKVMDLPSCMMGSGPLGTLSSACSSQTGSSSSGSQLSPSD